MTKIVSAQETTRAKKAAAIVPEFDACAAALKLLLLNHENG
jgi:hypothetical protein